MQYFQRLYKVYSFLQVQQIEFSDDYVEVTIGNVETLAFVFDQLRSGERYARNAGLLIDDLRFGLNNVQPEFRELADLLTAQSRQYFGALEIPPLQAALDLALFNCLRSAAFPQAYPIPLELRSDARGSLFEAVRSHRAGQTFFSTTHPGVTRGNHFHFGKVERFLVVGGQARISIRRLFDDQVHAFEVRGDQPVYIDMPTLHTHEITNVGDGELLTLFWAHEFFDPQRPDTYFEPVSLDAPVAAPR